jgi:hypothetical protein
MAPALYFIKLYLSEVCLFINLVNTYSYYTLAVLFLFRAICGRIETRGLKNNSNVVFASWAELLTNEGLGNQTFPFRRVINARTVLVS